MEVTARVQVRRANADPFRRVVLAGGTVLTVDPTAGNYRTADVLIEGSKLAAVGPDLASHIDSALVIDARGQIVMPGFVDTHRHCWQGQLRRILPNADLQKYKFMRDSFAVHYQPDDHYIGTLVSALGALNGGITCLVDISHNSRSSAHTDAAIRALFNAGIRGVHASAPPEAGAWDQQWPEDLYRLKRDWFPSDDQLVTLRMAQRCVDPVDGLTPSRIRIARDLGIGVSVDPVVFPVCSDLVLELSRGGHLGPDLQFIHCAGLTDDAWSAISAAGVGVSLSPMADSFLGFGRPALPTLQRALDHGIRPGLSVDVEPSLPGDMFSQMRTLMCLHRVLAVYLELEGPHRPITSRELIEFATIEGARTIGMIDRIGSLTPGKAADVILVNAGGVNLMPLNNAFGSVVLGASPADVEAVIVGGVFRKWAGNLLDVDERKMRLLAENSRDGLVARSGHQFDVFEDNDSELKALEGF